MTTVTSKIPGKEGKKIAYHTANTSTEKGLKEAEYLLENGWTIGSNGLFSIQFYKEV